MEEIEEIEYRRIIEAKENGNIIVHGSAPEILTSIACIANACKHYIAEDEIMKAVKFGLENDMAPTIKEEQIC